MNVTVDALAQLRREFAARGWARKATARVVSEWLFHLGVAFGGMWLFLSHDSIIVRVCGMLLSTAGSMGLATNTHTSSHYATSRRRWLNELLTFLGYPMFTGVSACYWWHKHIVLHHPAPNVMGVDSDIDLTPWFARTQEEIRSKSGWLRWYYDRLQPFVFPFTIPLIVFNMQVSGWRWLLSNPGRRWHSKRRIDFAAIALHYLVWVAVPLMFCAPANVAAFYFLRLGLLGCAMFVVLAPAHFPEEAVCLKGVDDKRDNVLLQAAATLNFRTGIVGRLICSGLQYQIEHHLFPTVSHVFYPKMAPLVKDFCLKHGIPYRSYSWDAIVWKCLRVFHAPPPIQADLELSRIRQS